MASTEFTETTRRAFLTGVGAAFVAPLVPTIPPVLNPRLINPSWTAHQMTIGEAPSQPAKLFFDLTDDATREVHRVYLSPESSLRVSQECEAAGYQAVDFQRILTEQTMPPPYKNATCRGSYALKNACGHCERCAEEVIKMAADHAASEKSAAQPEPIWTDNRLELECRCSFNPVAIISFRQMRALESIAESLQKMANPVIVSEETQIDEQGWMGFGGIRS